ncbi:MAG: tetratricopeptide repeat protein [Myxococcales bacterium]|nr:tetratricopeptide repeat protein [Myxococcales bacterium]
MIVSSLSSLSSKLVLGLVAAGWLATALASKNGDIEAGIAAYDAGDYDAALEAYAAAEETLGERAEIAYDRGLALLAKDDREAARKAFERGTESDNPQVRASSEYELGNLDFDAELWEAAIERYIACLKIDPEHASAKWNLELARLKKKQQEEEQEKQENEDQENQDQDKQDEDQENQDQENQDQEDQENQDQENQDKQDEGEDEKEQEQEQDQQGEDEQEEEKEQNQQGDQEPEKDEQKGEQQPQQQPVERADLDKALEELDAQDDFFSGRPLGRQQPVAKDW